MTTRLCRNTTALSMFFCILGCTPNTGDDPTGEVQTGEAIPTVPLYETTTISLWDEPCECTPHLTLSDETVEDFCRLPGAGGTDSFATSSCSMSTTFQLEEDTTGLAPNGQGTLVVNMSHLGEVGETSTYQISIDVAFRGEGGIIDTRSFIFCEEVLVPGQLPGLPGVMFCAGGTPYTSESEVAEFPCLFEAGKTYQVEISVYGQVQASSAQPDWGGEITFALDVNSVRVEF
jgi:hypothetical protein